MKQIRSSILIAALAAIVMESNAFAEARAGSDPVTLYGDLRYRLETVDQDGLTHNATASTVRLRAGIKTGEWHGVSALVEGEAITRAGPRHYNDTVNGRTSYPVVADPSDVLLNQAWLRWKPVGQVELTAGRQAINLDNQRWVGSVNWRQNDQTFDAVRATVKPLEGLELGYIHSWRVKRVFGPDSPQGIWRNTKIDSARVAYTVKGVGTVSAYGLWLDIPQAPASSSRTLGIRIAGEYPAGKGVKLLYAAEYARQRDFAANPARFALDYVLLEPGVKLGPIAIRLGYERLEGNGAVAVQTPLATLHAFNGWADKFLTTPANGLRDIYADATIQLPKIARVKGAALRMQYHDYNATRGGIDYGREWGAQLSAPLAGQLALTTKIARYTADRFATDTTKFWLALEYKLQGMPH